MKKIRNSGITGQRGVALIQKVVLEMGSLWHETGGLEAGIDGFVEFRDPGTGEVLNQILAVQSKATAGRFSSETDASVAFICEKDDIDYWMQGNLPVILVVSRPDTDEAYWVSVKEYFQDPKIRQTRKVVFDRARDRFDPSARDRLLACAAPSEGGTYFAPSRAEERIVTNLLTITRLPARLFHGFTDCSSGGEVRKRLNEQGAVGMDEWSIRRKRIVSVHDLGTGPWRAVCDMGTVEEFDVEEWAFSYDHDTRSDFVELLRQCLWARLRQIDVSYDRELDHFYFTATRSLSARVASYHSYSRDAQSTVFRAYTRKDAPDVVAYYRHHAFEGRFRQYEDAWFLQIDPTYRYTIDGHRPDRYGSDKLSRMRKLEKNPAVMGQVLMWASLLGDPEGGDLFASPAYPHLGFGQLASFDLPVGIDDDRWLASDENPEASEAAIQAGALDLFMEGGL